MTIEGQYLTYTEYQELGGEAIGEMPFQLLEFEARQYIDKYTLGRLKELSSQVNEVKLCDYKLINFIKSYKSLEEQNRAISSENIDGYSVSYADINSSFVSAKNEQIKDIIRTYLIDCKLDDDTPYLYRGVE